MTGQLRIEYFPFTFQLAFLPDNQTKKSSTFITLSSADTLETLQATIRNAIGGIADGWTAWTVSAERVKKDDDAQYTIDDLIDVDAEQIAFTTDPKKTLREAFMEDGDGIVVEPFVDGKSQVKERMDASKPLFGNGTDFFTQTYGPSLPPSTSKAVTIAPGVSRQTTAVTAMNRTGSNNIGMSRTGGFSFGSNIQRDVRGTVGLNNLGNTCFMNSALQCLAHLSELTEYFLTGVVNKEINPSNPLGTSGELARSYTSLLSQLFSPTGPYSVAPRDFKLKISRHAPSFSGYAQHDTQELLAFLLDGLHEDLNRIVKKPYVQNPEWEPSDDESLVKLAKEFWDGYKKRNDSVIVDLFQGQYQSTLVCPECEKVSITFDPFMYLTLPLPVNKRWNHEVYFVTWDVNRPNYKVSLNLPRSSTFRDIKGMLGKWFDAQPDNILAAEIFQNKFYKFIPDWSNVTDVHDHDTIFFYELPVPSGQSQGGAKRSPKDPFVLPVYTVSIRTYGGFNRFSRGREMWGFPFFVAISHEEAESEDAIYEALVDRYTQTTHLADELYTWEEVEAEEEPSTEAAEDAASSSQMDTSNDDEEKPAKPTEDADEDHDMEVVVAPPESDSKSAPNGAPENPYQEAEGEPRLRRGHAKPHLFTWTIQARNLNMDRALDRGVTAESGFEVTKGERYIEAEKQRKRDLQDPDALGLPTETSGFLRHGDAIICEWDDHIRTYLFGTGGNGKEARWRDTEPFMDPELKKEAAAAFAKQKAGISLEDCLDEFVKEEQLGEQDLWYCPRCKKHQQATKKFDIWKVPDILVVHLKRFSNSRLLRDKIDVLVDFPTEGLDLELRVHERAVAQKLKNQGVDIEALGMSDMSEPLIYDLFAVDEHMGGLGGGHYRAYAKNPDDGQWYHFDDSHVSKSSAEASVTPFAYVLFYRRRTSSPIGGVTTQLIEEAKVNRPKTPEFKTALDSKKEPSRELVLHTVAPRPSSASDDGDLQPLLPFSNMSDEALPAYDGFVRSTDPPASPTSYSQMADTTSQLGDDDYFRNFSSTSHYDRVHDWSQLGYRDNFDDGPTWGEPDTASDIMARETDPWGEPDSVSEMLMRSRPQTPVSDHFPLSRVLATTDDSLIPPPEGLDENYDELPGESVDNVPNVDK
ncbi:CSN-associated deubiquitinating enzyme Ubp12 [Tulasnella sp. 419]|nr:CSN-associated deubiquitinating enzyme Ubp12 [Tulasnella sp. 419]